MHGSRGPRPYRAARPRRGGFAAVLGGAAVSALAVAGVVAFLPAQPASAAGRPAAATVIAAPRTEAGTASVTAARVVARPAQAAPRPAQQAVRPDGVLGRWAAFGLLAVLVVIWITLTAGVVRVFTGMGYRRSAR